MHLQSERGHLGSGPFLHPQLDQGNLVQVHLHNTRAITTTLKGKMLKHKMSGTFSSAASSRTRP